VLVLSKRPVVLGVTTRLEDPTYSSPRPVMEGIFGALVRRHADEADPSEASI